MKISFHPSLSALKKPAPKPTNFVFTGQSGPQAGIVEAAVASRASAWVAWPSGGGCRINASSQEGSLLFNKRQTS